MRRLLASTFLALATPVLALAASLAAGCSEGSAQANAPRPGAHPGSDHAARVNGQMVAQATDNDDDSHGREHVSASGQLGPGKGTLIITLKPPRGAKLTEGAPLRVEARHEHMRFTKKIATKLDPDALPLRLPVVVEDGATGPARVDLSYYWCHQGDSAACRPEKARLLVELDLNGGGADGEAYFTYQPKL